MDDIAELKRRLHHLGTSLSVIDTFVKGVDPAPLTPIMKEIHKAALQSVQQIKDDFEFAHRVLGPIFSNTKRSSARKR